MTGIDSKLTDMEIDAIGEISNMCMGAAASTLSTILSKKVAITTPHVMDSNWPGLCEEYGDEFVCVRVSYTEGINGSNLLLFNMKDVLAISNIMIMQESTEITELELSAIGEVANQMIGASSTSLASIVNKLIDIEPPQVSVIKNGNASEVFTEDDFNSDEFIQVRFKLEIEDIVDSYLLQLFPIEFAKSLCKGVSNEEDDATLGNSMGDDVMQDVSKSNSNDTPQNNVSSGSGENLSQEEIQALFNQSSAGNSSSTSTSGSTPNGQQTANVNGQAMGMQNAMNPNMFPPNGMGMNGFGQPFDATFNNINVQQAQFASFVGGNQTPVPQPENIDLIMDVPLEVTVELGRTNKSISEILEFKPGTIVELNKATGTPIDVLVNGKLVARGEVVVIDENFGIRIVDIIK